MFETLILFWCADSVKNTIGPLYLAGRRAHVVQALDCLCRFSAAGFAVPKCLGQKPWKKTSWNKIRFSNAEHIYTSQQKYQDIYLSRLSLNACCRWALATTARFCMMWLPLIDDKLIRELDGHLVLCPLGLRSLYNKPRLSIPATDKRWHPWQQVEKTSWILNCGERAGEDSCAFQLQRFKWRADNTIISDCFWGESQKWAKAPKSTCPTESILNIAFFNFALLTSCIKVIHPKTAHLSQPKTDENTFQCCHYLSWSELKFFQAVAALRLVSACTDGDICGVAVEPVASPCIFSKVVRLTIKQSCVELCIHSAILLWRLPIYPHLFCLNFSTNKGPVASTFMEVAITMYFLRSNHPSCWSRLQLAAQVWEHFEAAHQLAKENRLPNVALVQVLFANAVHCCPQLCFLGQVKMELDISPKSCASPDWFNNDNWNECGSILNIVIIAMNGTWAF